MESPADEEVDKIKAQWKDREVRELEMSDEYGDYSFIVTSPSKAEWSKYVQEMTNAKGDFDLGVKAIERLALAQVKWPERAHVMQLFEKRPGMIQNFAEPLSELAGTGVKATIKKR